jgi:predicted enzyme related to lactoylglutathione lyase
MADALQGRILWYELLTKDMKAAERFYTAVVGWTVTPFAQSPQPYDMWTRAGDITVGGVMTIPPGMGFPPHWEFYVGVPKLEDGVAKIERQKGSALSPVIEVPTVGRLRTMKDPQGAVFSIYEPAAPPPRPEAEPEIGDVSWHELYTTDAAAALKFYSDIFGWRERNAMDMGPMGKYYIFGREWDLGGMMNKPKELAQVPPHWGLYFRVPDVHEGAERVKANGGKVLNGPMEVPDKSWIVNCMDPEGAGFSLHHRKP